MNQLEGSVTGTTHSVEVLDNTAREVGLYLDSHLDQLVEVVGTDLKHTQYPGEGPAINGGESLIDYTFNLFTSNGMSMQAPHISLTQNIVYTTE